MRVVSVGRSVSRVYCGTGISIWLGHKNHVAAATREESVLDSTGNGIDRRTIRAAGKSATPQQLRAREITSHPGNCQCSLTSNSFNIFLCDSVTFQRFQIELYVVVDDGISSFAGVVIVIKVVRSRIGYPRLRIVTSANGGAYSTLDFGVIKATRGES